ncbi:hypothetical protein Lesp02_41300 [Lentzea sp. NBRC 105346]|uniref:hypothetical protein n=1 Tax=Lentzea sp. NBRC 105346 TaxID=3032205 RepID=UPI00249FCF9A|nr:hypothetical protein [Lentzea sp. NBRC 105346]GLZ31942.1 hypothetical protein Lesp02_41300 [Lentzea sp. NBRC 105346]
MIVHWEDPVAACCTPDQVRDSVAMSLQAWVTAGLNLNLLVRHGLPVWCAEHRAAGSRTSCGRLRVSADEVVEQVGHGSRPG